ncbi:MAG TPA: tRNA 2-thiouridine(34) synthase MnmA [Candidatus Udaeobacter sp.]|nr:tRNA 2-thiouridine(34) synthase MnmA [Candidatus Udaeobacter sp.]
MSQNKQRVLLGMSGGVDSSVAGYLLREQGYEVIGVTMKVWPQDCISRAEDKCCGPQAIADARGVAHSLGIPHYVVDEVDQFERLVIDYFSSEYRAGRTPNPCVMCNEKVKFGNLWSKAAALGCDYIATGHYAIIEQHADHAILRKGRDPRKDQSYFLFSLRQPQLRRALTPLGKMTKPQIRGIAHSLGLKVADKIDSQEICFVPGNDYKAFLRSHLGENEFHRGQIYDVAGNFLGEHGGIEFFTIGQRRGLPGGSPEPRYVVDLDPATNRVIVGDVDDLVTDEFEIDRANWHPVTGPRYDELGCTAKIRYSHPGTRATLTRFEDGHAHVRLHDPQRAVTPGQAAVFYDGDIVLGGGWIFRGRRPERREAKSKDPAMVP